MKVAIATHFPSDPNAPRGGVEAVSVNLAQALAALEDLDVHILTFDANCKKSNVSPWQGATVHRLPGLKGSMLIGSATRGRFLVSEYLKLLKPDIVHAHDTYGIMVKGLSLPRVFTVHGFIYADTLLSGGHFPRLRSRLWKHAEMSAWADQPHIISISPYVRERLRGIAKGAIYDIDNPISEKFFSIKRQEQKSVVFSASVISKRKNTLALIDAFARLTSQGVKASLRLAGPVVEPEYGESVVERIRMHSLADRINLLGSIKSEEVVEELSRASVFALVSLEENSPMGIEEAMAAGVPALTSNRCGMPYMVEDKKSGFLVDPADIDSIGQALKALLENDDLRRKMGERSREIALDRFHPEKIALKTRDVYRAALKDGASCSR